MKRTGHFAVASAVLLAVIATLVVFHGPAARHVARSAQRLVRLARNATGIYAMPALTIRIWRGGGEPIFKVEVYASGRLVAWVPAGAAERTLPRESVERVVEIARGALGDFNAEGCGTVSGRLNADLYVMTNGEWSGSVCRGSGEWPRGPHTRRLFDEIRTCLPGGITLPVSVGH